MGSLTIRHKPADHDRMVTLAPEDPLPSHGWVWYDLIHPDRSEVESLAREHGWDRLSVEDVLDDSPLPKFADYGDHLFVVLHSLDLGGDGPALVEINAYLSPQSFITIRHGRSTPVDQMMEAAEAIPTFSDGGPDRMLARLTSALVSPYLLLIDSLELQMEGLEERALRRDPSVIAEVQALRRDVANLRRSLSPQREVLMALTREDATPIIGQRARLRFADAYEQAYRVVESLDLARLMLGSILETYRSAVAEEMNGTMKVLTVFAAILLPLSLLAGIWGMNFQYMPELAKPWGYYAALAVMLVVAIGLWAWFSRRGFVGGPRLRDVPKGLGLGLVRVATLPFRGVEAMVRAITSEQRGR